MQVTDNVLIQFFVELFRRLISKSPTFFKVWKVITGIPVLLIALPNALQVLHINLPQAFSPHVQDIVGWATTAMFFMSFLPSQSTATAVDVNGKILKKTDEEKLPFTAAKEKKALIKNNEVISEMVTTGTVSTKMIK